MTDRWFRVNRVGVGGDTDPYRPAYSDMVDGYSWTPTQAFDDTPTHVVRFYADADTLDSIAQNNDVVSLDGPPVDALKSAVGQERDANGWRDAFQLGDSEAESVS